MPLFLPHKGWHVKLKRDLEELEEHRLFREIEKANTNIIEDPPNEAVFSETFDTAKLEKAGLTRWVKPIWFWTSNDPVPFPEDAAGEEIEVCAGHSLVFRSHDKALQDLAKVHEPVRLLRELSRSGPGQTRFLADLVLGGDRETLAILADAL